jgi:hypothetical protein
LACNLIGDDIFLWAVIEETLKFIAIFSLVYLVGLRISAILFIGIGFGFIEALSYIDSLGYAELRPFHLHILNAVFMALFFYFASKARNLPLKVLYYGLALVIPILLHLGHNYLASNGFF